MNCPNCKSRMATVIVHDIFTASTDLEWVCLTTNCGARFSVAIGESHGAATEADWLEGPPPEEQAWIVLWDDTYIEPAKWSRDSHGEYSEMVLVRSGTQHRFAWRKHMRWKPLFLSPLPKVKVVGGRTK